MRTLFLLAICAASAACNIDFEADVPCDSSDDCPSNQVCDRTFFRCTDGDEPDAERDTELDVDEDLDAPDVDLDADVTEEVADTPADVVEDPSDDTDTVDDADSDVDEDSDGGDTDDTTTDPADDVPECVPSGPEVCDGVDNDCNGTIDDPPVCSGPCGPGMTLVDRGSGTTFCIDIYEASRPDATAENSGSTSTQAASRVGVLPWGSVGFGEAQAACISADKRLCSAFEWQSACQGAALTLYPYGNSYTSDGCNGSNVPPLDGPTPSGQFDGCVSADGTLDQSGNLEEWTSDGVVRGGAFASPQLNLRCSSRATADTGGPPLASYGFRCCQDPSE